MRSQAHYAAQVRLATAARARVEAATRPSQNEQQQSQQAEHARAALRAHSGTGAPAHGHSLPGGQLDPQLALQLQSLARDGHKIQAIRLLRQATHTDLHRQELRRSAVDMESLLIPVLILAVVAAGVAAGGPGDRPRQASAGRPARSRQPDRVRSWPARPPPSSTRSSTGRLYALIAQGQAMAAIKFYFEATGEGLRASRDAVGALAAHPQPFRGPQPQAAALEDDDDTPQRFPYRYRAIASKGDVTREVSSNMLNDEIYGRIRTLGPERRHRGRGDGADPALGHFPEAGPGVHRPPRRLDAALHAFRAAVSSAARTHSAEGQAATFRPRCRRAAAQTAGIPPRPASGPAARPSAGRRTLPPPGRPDPRGASRRRRCFPSPAGRRIPP